MNGAQNSQKPGVKDTTNMWLSWLSFPLGFSFCSRPAGTCMRIYIL